MKNNIKMICLVIILFVFLFLAKEIINRSKIAPINNQDIKIELSENTNLGDYVISATKDECTIKWHISRDYIDVKRSHCKGKSFTETKRMHQLILKKLAEKNKLTDFSTLSWGYFHETNDYSWCLPIAIASYNSPAYQDYRKNYPNSKLKFLNDLFVKLANNNFVYQELDQLFNEFGVKIRVSSVEKVFAGKVSSLPFKEKLIEEGINDNERVIYDAGMIYFAIEKSEI